MNLPLWTSHDNCKERVHCKRCQSLDADGIRWRTNAAKWFTMPLRADGTVECPIGNQPGCDPCSQTLPPRTDDEMAACLAACESCGHFGGMNQDGSVKCDRERCRTCSGNVLRKLHPRQGECKLNRWPMPAALTV